MVRVTGAGVAIHIKISNLYGTAPLTMSGATVAKAATGAAIRPTTLRPATFSLRPGAIVPAGQELVSDPIPLPVQALIRLAHARGIRIVGGTIMPFEGNQWSYPDGTPEPFALEQIRDQVNSWIRASGEYDAVADFERALLSPTDPDQLRPEFNVRDSQVGDWLHPNDAGLNAMAEAIDLDSL
ncbi:hypothetical protein ACFSKW_42915 [Nonomuraea mangrovi]|uniref:SGNH hydrolase-type esterase domain-containing protein n=1 Tax=Nonomuraea mangrovi TaxID=2316207 RepID=A0ABW4T916_9ACTN